MKVNKDHIIEKELFHKLKTQANKVLDIQNPKPFEFLLITLNSFKTCVPLFWDHKASGEIIFHLGFSEISEDFKLIDSRIEVIKDIVTEKKNIIHKDAIFYRITDCYWGGLFEWEADCHLVNSILFAIRRTDCGRDQVVEIINDLNKFLKDI